MAKRLDVLFVNPNSSKQVYQDLAKDYSAIEPPTWSLLLSNACRRGGYEVGILDCLADNLDDPLAVEVIENHNPRLVVFVVYGSEPNAGTKNMPGAISVCELLKLHNPTYKTCFVGSHTSALPKEVLALNCVDFVCQNEGVYTLQALLKTDFKSELDKVMGLGWKEGKELRLNFIGKIVPQHRMDIDLPGYAWDLLPKKNKFLDLYRSHFWFGDYKHENRTPYAALYTSLGCPFRCDFCCINILNRTDNSDNIAAADSNIFRYWSAEQTLKEIDYLVENGVKLIRLSDEMFFFQRNHYVPLLSRIKEKYGDKLHFWAYARVDTVLPKQLELFRAAGVRWLCLGIESANQTIRREVTKGSYQEVNIRQVVKEIHNSGIEIIANYIFGLPEDTLDTMQQTLDLSIELNTLMWNAYPCMPIPGSPLYLEAKKKDEIPKSYSGYSFHSYDCVPMATSSLLPEEVLRFRDEAFQKYWNRKEFLSLVSARCGTEARLNVENMLKVKLKRKLLGD